MEKNIDFNIRDEKYFNGDYFEKMKSSCLTEYEEDSKLYGFGITLFISVGLNTMLMLFVFLFYTSILNKETLPLPIGCFIHFISLFFIFIFIKMLWDKEVKEERIVFQKEVAELIKLKSFLKSILVEYSKILSRYSFSRKQRKIILKIYTILNEIYDIQWYFEDISELEKFKEYIKEVKIMNKPNIKNKNEVELLEKGQFLLDDLLLNYCSFSLTQMPKYFREMLNLHNVIPDKVQNRVSELCCRWKKSSDDSVILAKMYKSSSFDSLYNLFSIGQDILYNTDNFSKENVQNINTRIESFLNWSENFVDKM